MEEKFNILQKYNLWNNSEINLGYIRDTYVNEISDSTGNRLIKVLVGQRRSGKTYIMRQVINDLITKKSINAENTLFISKEYLDFDFLNSYKELDELIKLYKSKVSPQGKIYIFIDEIQNIDQWEKLVNSYSQDFTEDYELFISGSNSSMLSGELSTLLSGRYISFNIFPFSYSEYLGITNSKRDKQSYLEYMNSGGLPELFSIRTESLKSNYISAIKDTILLRDIIQRHNIREPKLLEDIFVFLVNNASSIISISSIVKFFKGLGRKTSYEGISTYLSYIEDTFIIHKCNRYNIKGKDIISGNAKYYINDLAYKNYLYSSYGYGIGYKLENLLFLELKRAGFDVYVGDVKNKEIDFVAKKNDEVLYVQSSYILVDENTIEREYSALEAINDSYEKIVISLDDFQYPIRNGIKHIRAWEFLQ